MARMWWRRRGRDLLRPHERLVIDAVAARLAPAATALFERQLGTTALVNRDLDDRDVYLYPNRRGPQRHDPLIAFPDRSDDLRLATVRVTGPRGSGKADVFVVRGHLFQVSFKPRPRDLGTPTSIQVESVTVHVDPMVEREDPGIEQRLAELDASIRAELEAMWADGTADAAGLAGRDEVFRIGLEDGDHIVLAQFDDTTYLVAPIDPSGKGVRRYLPDGDLEGTYPDIRSALDDRD